MLYNFKHQLTMKHLQQLGMAFLAILMGMNFAACSDDDNNEGGQGGNALGTSALRRRRMADHVVQQLWLRGRHQVPL